MKNQNENKAAEALLAKALLSSDNASLTEDEVHTLLAEAPELTAGEKLFFSQLNPDVSMTPPESKGADIIPFPLDPMLMEHAALSLGGHKTGHVGGASDNAKEKLIGRKREELLKRLNQNNGGN